MKKYFIIASLFLVAMSSFTTQEEEVIIPDEAIRFRVVAASDTKEDQATKKLVKDKLQGNIETVLKNSQSVQQTRQILKSQVSTFDTIVSQTLLEARKDSVYRVHYGLNYFPEKNYKGVTYPEGYYESLVVTLGAGQGENWWCVLFPPLCLLEAEENQTQDVEYKSFVKETLAKYF